MSTVHGPALALLGRPGSGKGTQAARLAERYGLVHLSTGELLRDAVASGSELGRRVAEVLDDGGLVDEVLVREVVASALGDADVRRRGVVLDGYPRTPAQLDDVDALLAPEGLDVGVLLDVPIELVRRRISWRRRCPSCGAAAIAVDGATETRCPSCGAEALARADDAADVVERRLATYETETAPLLDVLAERGHLVTVPAGGTPDDVFDRIVAAITPVLWGQGRAVG